MKTKLLFLALLTLIFESLSAQTFPTFGREIPVNIVALSFDAMEPSITADGNYMFFNSLNNGSTTSLFIANKVNDSTFAYVGPLTGANQGAVTPRLDAVASSDSANNFFWTSTRNFPNQFDNCFHGIFNGSDVMNIGRVHGTLYIYTAGWLMMDAAINYSGNLLYYTNAYFGPTYAGCGIPCEAKLGIAQKQNDSTFNKLSNSDALLLNVNNSNYIVYAPFIAKDGLELYHTRILKSNPTQTEMCVSIRSLTTDPFSLPSIIMASASTPEASTLTTDQQKMYYHKKVGSVYQLFLRYRNPIPTGINESPASIIKCYPNPASTLLNIDLNTNELIQVKILNVLGQEILNKEIQHSEKIDVSAFNEGIYFIQAGNKQGIFNEKIIISKK